MQKFYIRQESAERTIADVDKALDLVGARVKQQPETDCSPAEYIPESDGTFEVRASDSDCQGAMHLVRFQGWTVEGNAIEVSRVEENEQRLRQANQAPPDSLDLRGEAGGLEIF